MHSRKNTSERKKVLVYLFGSLGDTIVAIPALRALRRHFAGAEFVLLQNAQTNGVVAASEVMPAGLIDRSLDYQSKNKLGYFWLWKKIRREKFDAAVYLVISERPERSVTRDRYFFRSCGIPELIGFHSFSRDQLYPVDPNGRPAATEHEALRKLIRIECDGVDVLKNEDLSQPFFKFQPDDLEIVSKWLQPLRKNPNLPLVAIAPGCKTPANFWPTANFIEIAQKLSTENVCETVIVGGKNEAGIGDEIINAVGSGINAAGKLSVKESAILLSLCELYIGLDTGTTHLAAAVGTPCIAVFHERDNPGQWFPLGEGHTIFQHRVPCAGCRLSVCPIPDHPCMTAIPVQPVLAEIRRSLGSVPRADTESICGSPDDSLLVLRL